ncbi:MAG TPA: glycosyltransferase family 4 protein [Actinomycetota bacterium]|nr:glycosyltransferase family 4 protein [Actinomycetota bacterium]
MPFVIAAVVSTLLTPLAITVARRMSLVDRPGALKVHDRAVPLAGVAVAGAALAALLTRSTGRTAWLALALAIALVTGLLDDRRTIRPTTRLLLQAAAAAAVVAGGAEISSLGPLAWGGAALVVIATINAVNMVDGQDGLASGLVVIAGIGLAILSGGGSPAIVPLAAAGAAAGFLPWNLPPARAFLGDGGAYVLGVLLGAGAIETASGGWPELLTAGACLGVFAYELLSTVLRRLGHRAPTLAGDRDHSYDRLASRLRSRAASTYVMWIAGCVSVMIGLVVQHVRPLVGALVIAAATAVAAAIHTRLRPSIPEVQR